MTNLEKLLKFLIKENDYQELSVKTGVDADTVKKFTLDIFARIIPSNFNKIENSSHVDESDLVAIVSNFNDIVKEENLKVLITNAVKKYGIEVKDASAILMAALPIIHNNLQVIAAPKKTAETKAETKAEEKKEADKIYDNISSRAKEETKDFEEEKDPKALKKELKEQKKLAKKKVKDETGKADETDDGKLSTLEKVCIYIVLGCLALLIVTFIVILILM